MIAFRHQPSGNRVSLVCLACLLAACGEAPAGAFEITGRSYDASHVSHMALPKRLREVSGLAMAGPGRVYAHNDERGVVYVIDYLAARVVAEIELGAEDDFEGIATLGERLFLVTSRGVLFESRIGEAAATATATPHPGRLDCEVEGLTAAADGRSLLVACKNLPDDQSGIVVYTWDAGQNAYATSPALSLPEASLSDFLAERFPDRPAPKRIQPTGITVTDSGNLLLVAARQHLLLEFTPEGTPVAAALLDPAVHRQAEGIELDADGRLLLASEGDSKGERKTPGVLSVYEPID